MPDVRFTADLHLGHAKMAELRGFTSVAEHDRAVVAGLCQGATERTTTWVLGDVAFGDKQHALQLLSQLPGQLRLVSGNHDVTHPANHRTQDLSMWREVFITIDSAGMVRHDGRKFLLSHFPYDGDNEIAGIEEARFEQWRLPDLGKVLLHGHTHSPSRLRRSARGTLMVHVGLDAWGLKPVAIHEVAQLVSDAENG